MCAESSVGQTVADAGLRVNTYVKGFSQPTGVAFLDANGTALVTEKASGKVKLVENRGITKTVLDLPVSSFGEQGLLSIALSPSFATDRFVYLYHSAAANDGDLAISNKISRYVWNPTSKTLTFERKLIDLPAASINHNGGKLVFAPNGKLFTVIGDQGERQRTTNTETSPTISRVGSILRLQPNGKAVSTNPFYFAGSTAAHNDIWGYGVRNSFGLAFDPLTGDLWDTENGPEGMDEINRVPAGFNSGWTDLMGPSSRDADGTSGLVSLGARANYQEPRMSWASSIAPTDLEFVNSSRLGTSYRNDLVVGDANTGSLFHFDLTSNRRGLALSGPLADGVADNPGSKLDESESILFGSGFGTTTDIVNGPGGLYVLSLSKGALYRITANTSGAVPQGFRPLGFSPVPEPSATAVVIGAGLAWVSRRSRDRRGRRNRPGRPGRAR